MPSFIYRGNLKNPKTGDLRQWRLFLDGPVVDFLNIFSLLTILALKNILFVIISICFYNKTAFLLKDSRFMLTSVNHISTFFSEFYATKSLDNFAFALCKSVHSQFTVIFDQNSYLSACFNIFNDLSALLLVVISEIVCKNIVGSNFFLT